VPLKQKFTEVLRVDTLKRPRLKARFKTLSTNVTVLQFGRNAIPMYTTDNSYHCLTFYVMFNCTVMLLIYKFKQLLAG